MYVGLGQAGVPYPWREYSSKTEAAQVKYNEWAKEHGFCPVNPDGILGAGTCGALREVWRVEGESVFRSSLLENCQSYVEPSRCGGTKSSWLVPSAIVTIVAAGFVLWSRKAKR